MTGTRTLVGIDPSVSLTGVAAHSWSGSGLPDLVGLACVRSGEDGVEGLADRVAREVLLLSGRGAVASVEVPPPTARRDAGHARQAEIGWKIGYLSGLVSAALSREGLEVRLVEVSRWRETMLSLSGSWGFPAPRPGRERRTGKRTGPSSCRAVRARGGSSGSLVVTWECGAETRVRSAGRPSECPRCGAGAAGDVRDQWKRTAVSLASRFWPRTVRPLVDDARSRARKKEKADHELSGVSDACEAAWIALSAA